MVPEVPSVKKETGTTVFSYLVVYEGAVQKEDNYLSVNAECQVLCLTNTRERGR